MPATQEGQKARIVILSTKLCSDCIRAKRLFDEHGLLYHDIDIGVDSASPEDLALAVEVNPEGKYKVPAILFFASEVENSARAERVVSLSEPSNELILQALTAVRILAD